MDIVSFDDKFGLVKVNPLAARTTTSPTTCRATLCPSTLLGAEGYASIGCAAGHRTKPLPGADRPSGRWAGSRQGGVPAARGVTPL
jgi:phosphoadenosine phosphosulfate reductase